MEFNAQDTALVITDAQNDFLSPNGVALMSRAKFEQTYRPDGAMGCGGSVGTIRFVNP